jgi:hypothetical protein
MNAEPKEPPINAAPEASINQMRYRTTLPEQAMETLFAVARYLGINEAEERARPDFDGEAGFSKTIIRKIEELKRAAPNEPVAPLPSAARCWIAECDRIHCAGATPSFCGADPALAWTDINKPPQGVERASPQAEVWLREANGYIDQMVEAAYKANRTAVSEAAGKLRVHIAAPKAVCAAPIIEAAKRLLHEASLTIHQGEDLADLPQAGDRRADPGAANFRADIELVARAILAAPQAVDAPVAPAARDVLAERRRQIEAEGWTPEHDDAHNAGELAAAASAYALAAADKMHPYSQGDGEFGTDPPAMWCWARDWWKPGDPRRMLVKAGALILAEIERLDRASPTPAPKG